MSFDWAAFLILDVLSLFGTAVLSAVYMEV